MTREEFMDRLGGLYETVGRPSLEGRFVALLLLAEVEISLADAAEALGVTKAAVSKLVGPMIERGDVKRFGGSSTQQHFYSLVDDAFTRDLRTQADVSRAVAVATRAFLARRKPAPTARHRLENHARISTEAADALERVLRPEERRQAEDIENHLERNWDAVPPRKGRGRDPRAR